jgi:hypothetical protein
MAHDQCAIRCRIEPMPKQAAKVGARAQRIVAREARVEPGMPHSWSFLAAERRKAPDHCALERRIGRSEEVVDRANRHRRVRTDFLGHPPHDVRDDREGMDMLVSIDKVRWFAQDIREPLDLTCKARTHFHRIDPACQSVENHLAQRRARLSKALGQIEMQTNDYAVTIFP